MTFSQRSSIRAVALVAGLLVILCAPLAAYGKKHPPVSPIDLNSATLEELQQLPGVGPSTAQAIVTFREKSGAFKRVEDLLAVHGISQTKFQSIRPYVVVKPPPQGKH
jgi:competence protein ComEA